MKAARSTPARPHILLVEDEPGVQRALTLVLDAEGYRVTAAADGNEALASLEAHRPDLIITDYMMPGLDGLELLMRVRADRKLAAIPTLLLCSALPMAADPQGLADAVLQKPARVGRLLEVIALLIER